MQLSKLNRKGVAGTEVVIQLMVAVFVIGLLAMLIAITGASLMDSTNNADAISIINDTIQSVSSVPDNFSLWLVVGGLVVVIGLIAFVILTLRGTGMMGGGGSGGNDYIGNA